MANSWVTNDRESGLRLRLRFIDTTTPASPYLLPELFTHIMDDPESTALALARLERALRPRTGIYCTSPARLARALRPSD